VDRARSHDDEQAIVALANDPADRIARRRDQRFDWRAGDREEPDQVLRRWKRRHVLDPQVVGATGALAAAVAALGTGFADLCHDGLLQRKVEGQKKPPGVARRSWIRSAPAYAPASPTAERCENAK